MAYLVVRKVKGNFYLYRQESYREGGQVRTRTVDYLGAVAPSIGRQIQQTRGKLGQADIAALVTSVQNTVTAEIAPEAVTEPITSQATVTPPHTPPEPPQAATAPQRYKPESKPPPHPPEAAPHTRTMNAGGERVRVDMKTGEIVETLGVDLQTVITTEKPLAAYSDTLRLPPDLERHQLSDTALRRTHLRYGQRLKNLQINPSFAPRVSIAYGHPDKLIQKRDGSLVVQVSRRTGNKRHTVNKTALWKHYRQALSAAHLTAIERAQPERFQSLANALDYSHRAAKLLAFDCLKLATTPTQRLGLSLQLHFWDKIPASVRGKSSAEEFGQFSFETVNDWRAETVLILSEVQKSGWDGFAERNRKARRKLKANITRRRNALAEGGFFSKLSRKMSGKERKLIREIAQYEKRLSAVERLEDRVTLLKHNLRF